MPNAGLVTRAQIDKMIKARREVLDSIDWPAVKARDLRRVCIHECAHEVVARHFGAACAVAITPNPNGSIEEQFYTGQLEIFAKLPKPQTRLICLAGSIAEQVDRDPSVKADDLADWLENGTLELSPTDAVGAGAYKLRDVRRCISLVKKLWPAIETAARLAIDTARAKE